MEVRHSSRPRGQVGSSSPVPVPATGWKLPVASTPGLKSSHLEASVPELLTASTLDYSWEKAVLQPLPPLSSA